MDSASMLACAFLEPLQISGVIVVSEERRLTRITTLNDMRGNTGEIEAGLSGHVTVPITVLLNRSLGQWLGKGY
jgi:hypothetical protein